MSANLSIMLRNLDTEQIELIDSVLNDANIAYSAGNKKRVAGIFKAAKNNATGKTRKILAAFQKSPAIALALDLHYEYRGRGE